MSSYSSITDTRYQVLIETADKSETFSNKLNELEESSSQLDRHMKSVFDNDVTKDLEISECLRSKQYEILVKHSNTLELAVNLRRTLDQFIDDPTKFNAALDLLDFADRLHEQFPDLPLVTSLHDHTRPQRKYFLINLCNFLDDQKESSPDDLKHIVNLLDRCGHFNNRDIRLRFLQARDYWFNNECEARSESFDDLICFFCKSLPKIFEEFKYIFGDSNAQAVNRFAPIVSCNSTKEDGAIINSWLLLKTSTFILSLEMHLKTLSEAGLITPTTISDTMKKCFNLSNWLSAIGFNFDSQLRPLFSTAIIRESKLSIDKATSKFETDFTSIVSKSIESLLLPIEDDILRISNMRPEEQVPKSIEHYAVYKIYCLHIIDSLRWIRATQDLMSPLCLCIDVYTTLNDSFSRVLQATAIILNTDNNSKHPILSKISVLLVSEVLPFIDNYCQIIFPERLILHAMGLSKSEFKRICTSEPEKVKNLRLKPIFLDNYQRHLLNRV